MVVFRPLIFSVIIDTTGFMSTLLLFIFNLSHLFSIPLYLSLLSFVYRKTFLCSILTISHRVLFILVVALEITICIHNLSQAYFEIILKIVSLYV